jgi:hypothetical protein
VGGGGTDHLGGRDPFPPQFCQKPGLPAVVGPLDMRQEGDIGLQLNPFSSLERGLVTHEKDKVENRYLVTGGSHMSQNGGLHATQHDQYVRTWPWLGRHPVGGSPSG